MEKQEKIVQAIDKISMWILVGMIILIPAWFAVFKENFSIFELNKAIIFRAGLFGLISLGLFKISLTKKIVVPKTKIYWGVALAILAVVISTALSLDPQTSFIGLYGRQQGALILLEYILFFVVSSWLIDSRKKVEWLIKAIVFSSIVPVFYGLVQKVNLDPMHWASKMSRLFSTLGQPNFFAHYLVIVFPLSLYLAYQEKDRTKKSGYLILAVAIFYCILETLSRGAWVGMALGFIIAGLLVANYFKKNKQVVKVFGTGLAVLIVLFFGGKELMRRGVAVPGAINRLTTIFETKNGSARVRQLYWGSAVEEFRKTTWQRRLFGYGKDSQEVVYAKYYDTEWGAIEKLNSFPDRAHNLILDLWLEHGLIGLVCLSIVPIWLLLLAVKKGKKLGSDDKKLVISLAAAMASYFGAGLFGFALTTHYFLFNLIMALLLFQLVDEAVEVNLNNLTVFFRVTMAGAVTIFLWFWFVNFDVRYFIADHYFMLAKTGEYQKDCLKALDNMESTISWLGAPAYYNESYLMMYTNCMPLVGEENVGLVSDNLLYAINSMPKDQFKRFNNLTNVARAYSILGIHKDTKYFAESDKYYQELLKIAPKLVMTYYDYGRMVLWSKDADKAIKIFRQGIEITPKLDAPGMNGDHEVFVREQLFSYHRFIGEAYYAKNDYKKSLEECLIAEKLMPDNPLVYRLIADNYYKLKNINKAIEYNLKGEKTAPEEAFWKMSLAMLYKEKGDKIRAKKYAEEVKKLTPDNKQVDSLLKELSK